MLNTTWAESIERATEDEQRKLGFGPFFVHLGNLVTLPEVLIKEPKAGADVPLSWPVAPAPGWLTHRLDDEWSLTAWCALGGDWVFRQPESDKKRMLHISPETAPATRDSIVERLNEPLQLLAAGEVFAFYDSLFVIPNESFTMNSYRCHVAGREPLDLFLGFRGHARQYREVVTPGIYRAHNNPDEESSRRYRRKARVAANIVKQAVFEQHNLVLSSVQARGVLQHLWDHRPHGRARPELRRERRQVVCPQRVGSRRRMLSEKVLRGAQ